MSSLEFFRLIGDVIIYAAPIIALIYFISFIRNNRAYKIFTIYLFLIAMIQWGSYYVGRGGLNANNLYYSHYYFISQFILLSFFYFELLKSLLIKIVLVGVLLFVSYQFIDDPTIYLRYNPLGMAITHAILVVYAMIYLYKSLQGKKEFIIVNMGLLIYLISSTLIFASGNLVLDLDFSIETKRILINVNRFLALLFQILVLIEWFKNYRPNSRTK
ncbi:MAG: hypothetical protein Aureis2KO_17830 [Aureisphaera sp.]